MAVHLGVGKSPRPACGAGSRWDAAQITTTRGTTKVDCKTCQNTAAYKASVKK